MIRQNGCWNSTGFLNAELQVAFLYYERGWVTNSAPAQKKPISGFFCARNLRFLEAKRQKLRLFAAKQKRWGWVLDAFLHLTHPLSPCFRASNLQGLGCKRKLQLWQNLILSANVRNVPCLAINLHRMQFCCNFMWTIAFVCGIMFHEVIESFLLDLVVVTLF